MHVPLVASFDIRFTKFRAHQKIEQSFNAMRYSTLREAA